MGPVCACSYVHTQTHRSWHVLTPANPSEQLKASQQCRADRAAIYTTGKVTLPNLGAHFLPSATGQPSTFLENTGHQQSLLRVSVGGLLARHSTHLWSHPKYVTCRRGQFYYFRFTNQGTDTGRGSHIQRHSQKKVPTEASVLKS